MFYGTPRDRLFLRSFYFSQFLSKRVSIYIYICTCTETHVYIHAAWYGSTVCFKKNRCRVLSWIVPAAFGPARMGNLSSFVPARLRRRVDSLPARVLLIARSREVRCVKLPRAPDSVSCVHSSAHWLSDWPRSCTRSRRPRASPFR